MASEEDSPVMKTVKGAVTGLAAGTIWGTVVATWYDVPRVERHVALPGLIRTLKMCGSYGATFAAVGGLYIGVEQLVQSQRKKHDFVNGAIGAFVAGATVYGYRGILHFQELNLGIIQPSHPPIRHATTTTTRGQLPGTGGKDLASADGGRTRLRDEQLRQLRELFLRFDLDELASSLAPLLLGPCRPAGAGGRMGEGGSKGAVGHPL